MVEGDADLRPTGGPPPLSCAPAPEPSGSGTDSGCQDVGCPQAGRGYLARTPRSGYAATSAAYPPPISDTAVALTKEPTGHSTGCGGTCPQCGYVQAAEAAAERLLDEWGAARTLPQCGVSAAALAADLYRELQCRPDLTIKPIRSGWIRHAYPLFCRSRGVMSAPPFKDFAKALGQLMPKKRVETWRRGRRQTHTVYSMPGNVVPISRRA
jgi:hypothetical protein